jgi:hypothetical protein
MATPAQITANKQNAQKSTGPKTEEGKAASARNRLSHGFASSAILIEGENPEEFKALLAGLTDEYQPVTDTEVILVERMAQHQWLCLRAFHLQGIAFADELCKTSEFSIPKSLGLLIRYHTTADRAFHRAHNELVKTQKERKKSEIGFGPQKAAEPPAHTAPEPPRWTPETVTEDFIMNEPDLNLVEEALGIYKKAA